MGICKASEFRVLLAGVVVLLLAPPRPSTAQLTTDSRKTVDCNLRQFVLNPGAASVPCRLSDPVGGEIAWGGRGWEGGWTGASKNGGMSSAPQVRGNESGRQRVFFFCLWKRIQEGWDSSVSGWGGTFAGQNTGMP